MKRAISNYLGGENQLKEFKKELKLLLMFTLGFTIAFTWRQTIFDLSENFIQSLFSGQNSGALSILASTLITIVSLILIFISSHFLKDKSPY